MGAPTTLARERASRSEGTGFRRGDVMRVTSGETCLSRPSVTRILLHVRVVALLADIPLLVVAMALGGVERNLGRAAGALGALVLLGNRFDGFRHGFCHRSSPLLTEENADGGGIVPGCGSAGDAVVARLDRLNPPGIPPPGIPEATVMEIETPRRTGCSAFAEDNESWGSARCFHSYNSSYAGLTRVSIHLRIKRFQKRMDCRVKPGNDER
jgi:hypothetical protein